MLKNYISSSPISKMKLPTAMTIFCMYRLYTHKWGQQQDHSKNSGSKFVHVWTAILKFTTRTSRARGFPGNRPGASKSTLLIVTGFGSCSIASKRNGTNLGGRWTVILARWLALGSGDEVRAAFGAPQTRNLITSCGSCVRICVISAASNVDGSTCG